MDSVKTAPTNITDTSEIEKNKPTLRKRLRLAISDALSALSFESKVIDDFYLYASASYSKKHFRLALNFILLNCLYLMLIVSQSGSEDSFTMKYFGLFVMIVTIILYIASIGFLSPSQYPSISLILITVYISLHIYSHRTVASNANYNYILPVEIFIIIFAWLPFNIDISLSVTFMYSIIFSSFTEFRMIYFLQMNDPKQNVNQLKDQSKIYNDSIYYENTKVQIKNFPTGVLLQCLFLHIVGIYIHYSNRLRRRASFLRLGESVKSQMKNQTTFESIMKYIESIMPASIRDLYWEEKKLKESDDLWVFCNNFDNVTILFIDIVGFTLMNANKSALQVVELLNDLFQRFDQACEITHCEKIGTIGDSYYCVAGCPNARSDHAACCIEGGFKMLSEMKSFNKAKDEDLNMRIGIHTGRINGAIIGKLRFKFDIYSKDVYTTKEIASSGINGLVRISQTTYNLVNCIYTVNPAPTIEIKKEVPGGLQGMVVKTQTLQTYYVLNRDIISSSRNYRWQTDIQNSLLRPKRSPSCESVEYGNNREDGDKPNLSDPYHIFVHHIANDPDQIMKVFSWLPVHFIFLYFIDDEIEHEYQNHFHDYLSEVTLDSTKLAPLTDSLACMICSLLIFFSAFMMANEIVNELWFVFLAFIIGAILFTIIIAAISTYNPILMTGRFSKLFRTASNRIIMSILLTFMSSLPCLIAMSLYKHDLFYSDYPYTLFLIGIFTVSLLNFVLCCPIITSIKISALTIIVIISLVRLLISKSKFKAGPNSWWCNDNLWNEIGIRSALQICLNYIMIIFLNRENQKNLRLCFYITRTIEKRELEMNKKVTDAETILFNIIPSYVMDKISMKKGELIVGNLHYANSIRNAGIGFVCISNFFSSYYLESYQGGRNALGLLNKVFCMFDDLIHQYGREVEKVKTFNDNYLFASGLDADPEASMSDQRRHFYLCIQFSFAMINKLKEFNQDYIFGNEKFKLKVGLNIGQVTVGIVGTSRPTFNIWGQAVNTASLLGVVTKSGVIIVTKQFPLYLSQACTFKSLGEHTVTARERMELFECEKITDKNFLDNYSNTSTATSFTTGSSDTS